MSEAPVPSESQPSVEPPAKQSAPDCAGKVSASTAESEGPKPITLPPAPASNGNDTPASGTELCGRVAVINGDQIFLDVGLKRQAVIPCDQFDNGAAPAVGSEVDVIVASFDVPTDLLRVNRKGTPVVSAFADMTVGAVLEGRISGMNKGGLEVEFGPVRGFMPASQVDTRTLKDISVLLGQDARCEVIEIDEKHQKLVVSRRSVLKKELADSRARLLRELEVGQVMKGVVTNLAEFGAFVDLGGFHGLVHISDMKWTPVEQVSDVLGIGDEVEVKVLKINKDRKRISLGMKQVTPDPWIGVKDAFKIGSKIQARITKLAEFGAFGEVSEGVIGLIPLSEVSWTHHPTGAGETLKVGESVEVVVIGVDTKRHRMSLSVRQTTEDPWSNVSESFTAGTTVTGKVSTLLDFGALVELSPGIEGMIHISELSRQRVATPGDVVSVGQDVSVKVLNVDPKKRRVSLSIRATLEPEPDATPTEVVLKKKRKKPLRGGLSSHFDW